MIAERRGTNKVNPLVTPAASVQLQSREGNLHQLVASLNEGDGCENSGKLMGWYQRGVGGTESRRSAQVVPFPLVPLAEY